MKRTLIDLLIAVALAAAGAAAAAHGDAGHTGKATAVRKEQKDWGIAGDARSAGRTVEFRMTDDMRFMPDRLEVRQGETLRIVVRNTGKLLHEYVLGTQQELDAHAALMLKFPDMEHDEPYMLHVPPGQTGRMVWTFNRAGEFDFACLIAGHYQAGMVGKVSVTAATRPAATGNRFPAQRMTGRSTPPFTSPPKEITL